MHGADGTLGVRTLLGIAAHADRPGRLSACHLPAWTALVRASPSNSGQVYVGDATVRAGGPGLNPGRSVRLRGDPHLDLYDVFIAAEMDGDAVDVWYLDCA
jgi:hypothetical protein